MQSRVFDSLSQAMMIQALFAVMAVLSVIDWFVTALMVQVDGSYAEYNPLMRMAIEHYGMGGVALIKASSLIALGVVIIMARKTHQTLLENCLMWCVAIYFINVIWGLWVSYE